MNITVSHIPYSTVKNRRPNIKMVPDAITVHSTGNDDSVATGERAWLENPDNSRTASWHYVVDENAIIEAIPPNEVAWHAGDGNGNGNMRSISIEMCESGDRAKVLQKTKELIVYLMKKHNIRKVVRHYDWTKKNCPRILNGDGKWTDWHKFLSSVMTMADEAKFSGWKKVEGVWFYYEKGSFVRSKWIETKDKWYWLKADGKMAENEWVKYKEKWYYLGAGGAMYEDGIFKVKDEYYFFNKEGDMVENSSRPVRFGANGKIIVG